MPQFLNPLAQLLLMWATIMVLDSLAEIRSAANIVVTSWETWINECVDVVFHVPKIYTLSQK